MTPEQLKQLQEARELIKRGHSTIESLYLKVGIDKRYRDMLNKAESTLFDLLTGNLNVIEHDVLHEGVKDA